MAGHPAIKSGTTFKTLKAAQEQFRNIWGATGHGNSVAQADTSNVLDACQRDCAVANRTPEDDVDVTTTGDSRQRQSGSDAQTKAVATCAAFAA